MQQMEGEAFEAAIAEDWRTAILVSGQAADEADKAHRELVNLARTVGGLSDQAVADIRGTSPQAVTQRYGARSRLLRDAMTTGWQAAQAEWRKRRQGPSE